MVAFCLSATRGYSAFTVLYVVRNACEKTSSYVKVKNKYGKPELTQMKAQIIFFIVLFELPIPKSILENQGHEDEAKPPTCAGFFMCVASCSSKIND